MDKIFADTKFPGEDNLYKETLRPQGRKTILKRLEVNELNSIWPENTISSSVLSKNK